MADDDLRKELEQLRKDFAALRKDVTDLTSTLKARGTNKAESVKSGIEEEIRKRRDELREKVAEARAQGEEMKGEFEEQVAYHPYTSLLTAFGVGFVLAKLMHLGERH